MKTRPLQSWLSLATEVLNRAANSSHLTALETGATVGTGGIIGVYLGHLLEASEVSPQPLPESLGVEARQVRVYQSLPLHGDAGPKLARRLLLGGQTLERRSAQLHPARQPCGGCEYGVHM